MNAPRPLPELMNIMGRMYGFRASGIPLAEAYVLCNDAGSPLLLASDDIVTPVDPQKLVTVALVAAAAQWAFALLVAGEEVPLVIEADAVQAVYGIAYSIPEDAALLETGTQPSISVQQCFAHGITYATRVFGSATEMENMRQMQSVLFKGRQLLQIVHAPPRAGYH